MLHGLKKFLLGLAIVAIVFMALGFSPRTANAMRCAQPDPFGGCFAPRPDYPPGGRDCTGSPGTGEVNIFTGPNRTGWCVTIPARFGMWNLNSTNGWYSPFYVKTIDVGSGVTNGWVCKGPNLTVACYVLYSPTWYSYTNPPYGTTEPGWQSLYVGD